MVLLSLCFLAHAISYETLASEKARVGQGRPCSSALPPPPTTISNSSSKAQGGCIQKAWSTLVKPLPVHLHQGQVPPHHSGFAPSLLTYTLIQGKESFTPPSSFPITFVPPSLGVDRAWHEIYHMQAG